MAWITITEGDLLKTKMAPLMNALRTAALEPGQEDPVTATVADVIVRIRNKVATCATNKVDANTDTIPASLKALACRLVIVEAKSRLEIDLTEDERTQWRIDEGELNRVAGCDLVVDQPAEPAAPAVQQVQPGPTISARPPKFKRWQQRGA